MGLFDSLKCEYPLPDPEVQNLGFQTKSLGRQMMCFVLTAEGQLVGKSAMGEFPYEIAEDPNNEFGPAEDVAYPVHGFVTFYTGTEYSSETNTGKWWEYKAKFRNGKLFSLERSSNHWKSFKSQLEKS